VAVSPSELIFLHHSDMLRLIRCLKRGVDMQHRLINRHATVVIAAAPVGAAVLGSLFNIWYNVTQVDPLLTEQQRELFTDGILLYNATVYPLLIVVWLWTVRPIQQTFPILYMGGEVDPQILRQAQKRAINLPWCVGAILGLGWALSVPALLTALNRSSELVDSRILFHLPVSIVIASLITMTHGFFIVELLTERLLFPTLFGKESPSGIPGTISLPLNRRNLLCAVAVCVCPILSLVLLAFVDADSLNDLNWFMVYVGGVGILLGMFCSWMVSNHVVLPINALKNSAQKIASGSLDAKIELRRADEFGPLIDEFNFMIDEMQAKRELRQRFGLHVGRHTAELILAQDAGLTGTEQDITVMFCDIRNFTARCSVTPAREIVPLLNRFLTMMVDVVEDHHGGNVNKFLGDGFMALFGIGLESRENVDESQHARAAVRAGLEMIRQLKQMNAELARDDVPDLGIGIGLHSGSAIVGSIGSNDRLEYTAIGDTVNVASRVEGLTKVAGSPLLVTRAVRERLGDEFVVNELEPQSVKGQSQPIEIFSIESEKDVPIS
jgi:adenylate cyclase